MNATVFAGTLLAGLVLTAPVSAQQVAASIRIGSGPVAGHVVVAQGYSSYRHRSCTGTPTRAG